LGKLSVIELIAVMRRIFTAPCDRAHKAAYYSSAKQDEGALTQLTIHIATVSRQVCCWGMACLPATCVGGWFCLYLILDLYIRKIVGWEAHEKGCVDHAAHLVRGTALAEGIAAPLRLHQAGARGYKATLGFALGLMAVSAAAAPFDSIPYRVAYFKEFGASDGLLYENPDAVCAKILDAVNTGAFYIYTKPRAGVKPPYGLGCFYDLIALPGGGYPPGTVIPDWFAQNWVSLRRICPAKYTLAQRFGGSPSYEYYECVSPRPVPPWKQNPCPSTPNPTLIGTGIKIDVQNDYPALAGNGLLFTRNYRSVASWGDAGYVGVLGFNWYHVYDLNIKLLDNSNDASLVVAAANRADGTVSLFALNQGAWIPDSDVADKLERLTDAAGNPTGWRYTSTDGAIETYDATGKLISLANRAGLTQTLTYTDGTSGTNGGNMIDVNGNPTAMPLPSGLLLRVTDATSRTLTFGYDNKLRMVKVTDPNGGIYQYKYDEASSIVPSGQLLSNNLTSVTYPDGAIRQYGYNDQTFTSNTNLPHALTSITDLPAGVATGTRYASYWYDAQGRAVKEEHAPGLALGIDQYQLTYNIDSSGNPTNTVVTDPLGTARTYNFTTILGVVKSTGQSQPGGSGCGAASSAMSYDANGNVASRADFNGNKTCYAYDLARNLETARVEGLNSTDDCAAALAASTQSGVARKTTTAWHPSYRLPTLITEPGRETSYTYDPSSGNVLTKRIKDTASGKTRTWTRTYTTAADGTLANLLKTVDGPRADANDVTTYSYYPNGDLKTVSNALGHVTTLSQYDANGRLLALSDPNGLVTTLTYTPRGWLKSKTVGTEATSYDYDGVGQIKRVTLPDGSYITYDYDDAHRLTGIHDAQGNRLHYTLDAIGNRTREEVYNSVGALVNTRSRVFDALNRLWKDLGALNQTTTYEYDANGNLTKIDGPLTTQNDVTQLSYDALNRLSATTDGLLHMTRYQYDGLDQLTRVTDPRNLATQYTVNGLGEQTQEASPDTGATGSIYDTAGNLKTRTDADGKTVSYDYDALNRVIRISHNGIVAYTFSYDQGPNALGKLTGMTGGSGPASYTYTGSGRLAAKTQDGGVAGTFTTRYGYYPSGQLASMTYPSGKIVAYSYNTLGQVDTLTVDGRPLIQSARYQPFGPVAGWLWGNNTPYARNFDSDGRIANFPMGAAHSRTLIYDEASRIDGYIDTSPAAAFLLRYDAADRLTDWIAPNTTQLYTYDANGNRKLLTLGGNNYANTISATSNRLLSVAGPIARTYSYNNAGSLLDDGTRTFTYDGGNRMNSVSYPGGSNAYLINALGQRTLKTGTPVSTHFVYDEGGKLIGEYDPGGVPIEETVYLGEMPVAVLR
jgi:YD repeat-containing protein